MSPVHRLRPVAVGALVLALGGCSQADVADEQPSARPAPATLSAGGSSSPSATPCSTDVSVRVVRRDPQVLYAQRFTVAAGQRSRASTDARLYTSPPLDPGVHTLPAVAGSPPDAVEDEVLERLLPSGTSLLDDVRGLSWDVRNEETSGRTRYLAWAGAVVTYARWSARTCDGDRRRLAGDALVVGRIAQGTARCGRTPMPRDELHARADGLACARDSAEARPFRTPARGAVTG